TPPTRTYPLSLHDALPILLLASATGWTSGSAVLYRNEVSPSPIGIGSPARRATTLWSWAALLIMETSSRGRPSEGRSAKVAILRSEEHTSELQSRENLVCR